MPIFAGIALTGLIAGATAYVELASTEDTNYKKSYTVTWGGDVESSFKALFPDERPASISISLPTFLEREERKPFITARRAAKLPSPAFYESRQVAHKILIDGDYEPANELLIEIASSGVVARLVSTFVEEGFRDSTTIKEFALTSNFRDSDIADAVQTATADLEGNLRRIILIDSKNTSRTTSQFDYKGTPIDLVAVDYPSIARQVARSAISAHQSLHGPDTLVTDLAVLRLGIVKADGFVHTLIPKHTNFPVTKSAVLTTAKDGQTSVTIAVVLGISPLGSKNLEIAKLRITNLPPSSPAIRITAQAEQIGPLTIRAEVVGTDLTTEARPGGFVGDLESDEIEELYESHKDDPELDEKAVEAEDLWVGKEMQGALPE